MKLLREYIRETLLAESARDLIDIEEQDYEVVCTDQGDTFQIGIYGKSAHTRRGQVQKGKIVVGRYKDADAQCMNAYEVQHSNVEEKGWGPLLYDLSMELATSKGSGLIADRGLVSDEAINVWNYYMTSRGDVEQIQLDDWDDNLTPGDKSDNCDQSFAYSRGVDGEYWEEDNDEMPWDPDGKDVLLKSPLTKMYRWKGESKIAALKKMKRWRDK